MADEQTANVEVTEQVTDTSTEVEDKPTDDTEDVNLEDIEVNLEDISESEEKSDDETESESKETDTKEETEVEESKEKEVSEEDKRKAFNKEMAERRIQEKQQRELTLKQQQEEYLTTAEDNRDLALRQLQIDAYNNKIDSNTNKLTNGYERALKDFEVLGDQTPEIKAEIDQAIDAFQAMHVTLDAYGNPIEVREDIYQYLQSKAESIAQLTRIGERKQSMSKSKEKSKTLTMPTRAPQKPKVDADLAAFEEEASRW